MKRFITEFKWGLIFSVFSLLWMMFERVLGWHSTQIDKHALYSMLFIIPAIVVYYFALKEKRDKYLNGKMTWSQGVISGLILGIIVALISPITQYITHYFISPDYFTNAINFAVESNKLTEEEATKYFNFNNYLVQSIVSAPIMGILNAGIVSLFLRKN